MEGLGIIFMDNRILQEDLEYIFDKFTEKGKLSGSTILVTGCAGFLGFYLLNFFLKYAKELRIRSVIGLDNFKLGKEGWIKELAAKNKKVFRLYDFDISGGDIGKVPGAHRANIIIHMASIASPTFYRKYPLETIDANIWGLRKLLDYYKDKSIRSLLFFSSSEVYGDPSPQFIPTAEDYRGNVASIGPRACYDESKRFGETLCYVYASEHKMPIVAVRPFNNYGPGMKLGDKRVPADFAKAIFDNRDISILSDGSPKRTFCYITDAVVGYLKALAYGKFDVFNIGIESPEISIKSLAGIYVKYGRRIFGYNGDIKFEKSKDAAYLTHNPSRRCPDISKARRLLNYQPGISVEKGVGRYLEFIKIRSEQL